MLGRKDAMVLVSKNAKPGSKLRKACGGAATKVALVKSNAPAESLRGIVAGELLEKKTSKMYPLHGACVRHQVGVGAFPNPGALFADCPEFLRNTRDLKD